MTIGAHEEYELGMDFAGEVSRLFEGCEANTCLIFLSVVVSLNLTVP